MRAPACDPTATISSPALVTRPSVGAMPRPLSAAMKSLPASVAGGKPRRGRGRRGARVAAVRARYHDDGDTEHDHGEDRDRHPGPPAAELEPGSEFLRPTAFGGLGQQRAQQPGPLGAGRPQIRPRPAAPDAGRRALARAGRPERGLPWRGPPDAGRARAGRARAGRARGCRGWRRPGVLRRVVEFESGHAELVVVGPRLRRVADSGWPSRTRGRLPPSGGSGNAAARRPQDRVPAPGRAGSAWPPAWPGVPPLELEPGGGPAPAGITASWIGQAGTPGMAAGMAARGMGPAAARGKGPVARAGWGRWRRAGRGRGWRAGGPGGGSAGRRTRGGRAGGRRASGLPVGSLVTCALPSSGCPRRKVQETGDKPGKPICHFPADGTGRDRA